MTLSEQPQQQQKQQRNKNNEHIYNDETSNLKIIFQRANQRMRKEPDQEQEMAVMRQRRRQRRHRCRRHRHRRQRHWNYAKWEIAGRYVHTHRQPMYSHLHSNAVFWHVSLLTNT